MGEKRRPANLQADGARREQTANAATVARPAAAVVPIREDLVLELALRDDWLERVAALRLPAREAREMRIKVLGARVFHAGKITSRARAGRPAKSGRTGA